jgi:PAS domain S-box-containing protein
VLSLNPILVVILIGLLFALAACWLSRHRRLAASALRLAESEERFRAIFEHGGAGLAFLAPDGRILQVNPALARMLDFAPSELIGRHLNELAYSEDRAGKTDGPERELRFVHREGHTVWVRLHCFPVPGPSGQPLHQAAVVVDLSERKEAEESLRQAEETLRGERDFIRQVLETADALIMVADASGRVLRFNARCVAASGCSEEEARESYFWDFLLPGLASEAAFTCLRSGPARSGPDLAAAGSFESQWRTPTGEERLIVWRISVVHTAAGVPHYFIGVGLDVTEQRRLEEQLTRARKMESLSTLVGGIAHDFNNQLTAILGNLGLVRADLNQFEARGSRASESLGIPSNGADHSASLLGLKGSVTDAERAALRCADMTRRLLTFSKGRIGTPQTMLVEPLVAEVARQAREAWGPGIRVVTTAEAECWAVTGDPAQIQEALLALTANACDAMPNGGTLTLTTAHCQFDRTDVAANPEARSGRFVEIRVHDSGVGMTLEVQGRLFEPFFTTKGLGNGTGLGLAMVYGIAKAHGGWVRAESAPGAGSTFFLYLPASATSVVTPSRVSRRPVQPDHACILVVDDEPVVRDLGRAVLERAGFRVLTADNGEEALDLHRARGSEIDLVLLDYAMPRLNGLQVLEELRTRDPGVRVIFTSGYTMDSDAERLLSAGARAFVPKPYRTSELIDAVRGALGEE